MFCYFYRAYVSKYPIMLEMKHYLLVIWMTICLTGYARTGREIIAENGFKASVAPMLSTEWSQDGGENSMLPYLDSDGSEQAVTGCGATALGQVLKFWEQPARGTSDNFYVWDSPLGEKVVLYADFEHTDYDWNDMILRYKDNPSATEQQIDAVSTLMLHIGIALEMKYTMNDDSNNTPTLIEYIHTALKKYFGYNPNSRLVRFSHGAYSMDEWLAMIYRELSEGRPVLMGGRYKGTKGEANHIFVTDGYDEDGKVHLNLGHANIGFNKDTYYDLTRDDETYTREMRMIVGISPQTLPAELTTIHVSTPGTLVEKLGGKSESRKICRLKVTGTLNAADVAWLKELAQSTTGQLSYLDLSDCDIQGKSLPESAFDECMALQEIILPNSLETIGSKAFRNCYGLYKVELPQGLSRIENYAFTGCRCLGEVSLPSTVSDIGNNPFRYDKLDRFEMNADNANYKIENHALLTKDGKKLLSMPVKCPGEYVVPEGVETIGIQAFLKSCMMTSVVLPASLKKIQTMAFVECYSLQDVYCHATKTPAISSESFDPAIAACTLHVPVGCADEYWENGWDKFARIVDDIITEGISTVMEDADSRIVRYSITGQPIRETHPNQIYIEKDWRGNSRKIIAK